MIRNNDSLRFVVVLFCIFFLFNSCTNNEPKEENSILQQLCDEWAGLINETEEDFNCQLFRKDFDVFYFWVNESLFSKESRNSETMYYSINHRDKLKSLSKHLEDLNNLLLLKEDLNISDFNLCITNISSDFSELNMINKDFIEYTDNALLQYFRISVFSSIVFVILILIISTIEINRKKRQLSNTKDLLSNTLKIQEEERGRIARELHDTLAQDMRYINLLASKVENDDLRNEIKTKQTDCINQIRNLCNNYVSPVIVENDFVSTLQNMISDFKEQYKISGKLVILEDISFSVFNNDELISLYRIIQEALLNIQKHAEATEFTILFRKDKLANNTYQIKLIITDDGKGIAPDTLQQLNSPNSIIKKQDGYHFGIRGMRERIEFLSGSLRIDSIPMEGTELLITFPG